MIDYQKGKTSCEICNKEYKSMKSLNLHISSSHKEMSPIEYYLKYLNIKSDGKCRFCGEMAQFKGFTKGFLNVCTNIKCIKKSFAPFSKEYKMVIDGLSEKEYQIWKIENFKIKSENAKKLFEKKIENDPNFHRKNSRYCEEFWIKKGYSLKESEEKAKFEIEKNRNILKKIIKDNPEYMKRKTWTSKDYWVKRGYTLEEAESTVSEKQSTFSLRKCIEKYGEEKGIEVWKSRQEKWIKTLDSKSDEEKMEILRKKTFANKAYSNISQELFFSIIENEMVDKKKCFFYLLNEEKILEHGKDIFKPDFIYNNKIIEFFGNYWHANPKFYSNFEKKIRRGTKNYSVESIWKIDEYRLNFFKKNGYEVLVIWEEDYRKDKKTTIKKCIEFLNS